MSKEQRYLDPAHQDALFAALKAAAQIALQNGQAPQDFTTETGQSQDTPDQGAQISASQPPPSNAVVGQDTGSVDYSRLQNLFRDAASNHPIAMQEGDKTHPLDAIKTIAQNLDPAVAKLATGAKITRNRNGELVAHPITSAPLGRLFGIHTSRPVTDANFYEAAKNSDVLPYLPAGMMRMPDGTPMVTKDDFAQALAAKKGQVGLNMMVPLDRAKVLGMINDKQYDALTAMGVKEIPQRELGTGVQAAMVGIRGKQYNLNVLKFKQDQLDNLINNISDATAKGAAMGQVNTLNWGVHARQIANQAFNPKTKQYELKPQMLAEMTMDLNRMNTGSSQVSEEARQDIQAATIQGHWARLAQLAGINDFNGTSQDLAKMFVGMVDRQATAANDLLNATFARQLARGQYMNAEDRNKAVNQAFGTTDYRTYLKSLPDVGLNEVPPPAELGGRGTVPPVPGAQPKPVPLATKNLGGKTYIQINGKWFAK